MTITEEAGFGLEHNGFDIDQNGGGSGPERPLASSRVDLRAVDVPLLYVAGATEGTVQWKAERFQLVNWGGFEGRERFDFHPGSTLISGASGTGKSTLLDAYIALMMPADVPFNGASNDAVGGRARSADQRNLLSYLRGQTDTTTDESTGRERAKVLRGDRVATWGAIGMTFVNDHGRRFTALRAYYVPARASRVGEYTMRMATIEGELDLADLAGAVESVFAPKVLKSMFPGLKTHDTYAAFASTLHTRLGIGANGDGEKALRLLVRIQSGHQIRTVDELYKEMVLERPATFAAADRAIEHFDALETAYVAMQTEQKKADLLRPITARHAALLAAEAEMDTIDTFGLTATGDTPIALWALRTEGQLLDVAVDTNRDQRAATFDLLRAATQKESGLAGQLDDAKEEHRANGGADLERLTQLIEQERTRRDHKVLTRSQVAQATVALGAPLATQNDFDRLHADATGFLAAFSATAAELRGRRDDLLRSQVPLSSRKRELVDERTSLAGRSGRVPKFLDDLRRDAAAAAGMTCDELPFVAELIDVAADQTRWRPALETVLGGSARTLLVPLEQLEHFSRAIDPLHLRGQLTFQGAPHAAHRDRSADPSRVAGKLLFKESPFSEWVHAHISDPARNALCVETPADLAGPGYRVTLAGQTRRGTRGTHGKADRANIIGFSSDEAIADIDTQLASLDTQLDTLGDQVRAVERTQDDLERKRAGYEAALRYTWDDIDVDGAQARIDEHAQARDRILSADDRLQALQAHIDHLAGQLELARETRFGLERDKKDLAAEHETLFSRQDDVNDELERLDREGRIALTDEHAARLDDEFTQASAPNDPADLGEFVANLARLRTRLSASLETARAEADRARDDLIRTFSLYLDQWPDPNLSTTIEAYGDYAAVLETILATGLHERQAEWRARLTKWSGEDLVPLAGAMESAIDDIRDRMDPINAILSNLPFGANRDRLRIKLRRLTPDHVVTFKRELRTLSSGATKELSEHELEGRFKSLRTFMAQLRHRNDPRALPDLSDRDRLLDVRRHVEITAERHSLDGALLSTHAALGGKSGGESQELVAFIVGAALRFRLGDDENARPTFAPVFLDEGFVKSDAEFAGRAVEAWKGLGFQLIVGAPLDKVTALEPHMDEFLAITKNTTTHYSFVHRVKDGPRAEALR
ncbi:ATP-binding protein [Pedococcus bigeumensis]|uniref:ATP-binding protein n=1 Tax=Pedococcus bigeumensis TaxID=433644 RepID=UPI002FE88EE5